MMIGQACLAKRRQTPLKRTMGVALLDRMMPALHKHNEVIMSIIIIRQVPAASGLVKLTTSSSPPHPETHNRIIIISIENPPTPLLLLLIPILLHILTSNSLPPQVPISKI